MRRDEIDGLYNAFHQDNLESILERGILSHELAAPIPHRSVADEAVQGRRATIIVPPSGRRLHTYANLYINPRNIVIYRFKRDVEDAGGSDEELCVVRVSLGTLDLPDVIVTDRNAASLPRWMEPDAGLAELSHADIFARYWQDKNHAQRMCAEVLVPDRVPPELVAEVYVSCDGARPGVQGVCGDVPVAVRGSLFFRQ
jgi:ssDNA thymidine ADP-ribosyltransferase, DarT